MNRNIRVDSSTIAACGLYCGGCRKYLSDKCPGCRLNDKASWCKIRKCCKGKNIQSCADCQMDVKDCKTYSNLPGKIFGILFNSDRKACIAFIKQYGYEEFAKEMTNKKAQTIKRK